MQRIRISGMLMAFVVCAPLAAFAQNAAGTWELTIKLPQGSNTMNVTLTQSGDALAGTLSSAFGSAPMTGTASGAEVTFTGELSVQGRSLPLTFKGKIDADTFNGNVQIAGMGESPFTGRRAKADAPDISTAARPPATSEPVPVGVTGKWDLVLSLPNAELPVTATLTQTDDKVTGILNTPTGDLPVTGSMIAARSR